MLHRDKSVIHRETYVLIQELCQIPELNFFYLVGGTGLALQLGHRLSIDIDLFTQEEFSPESIIESLRYHFDIQVLSISKNTLLSQINNIKTDFIRHNYPLINAPISEDNITYLSLEDIAAMKLNVISNSGKRMKDFIDIYYLLEHFSLKEMLNFYQFKYSHHNPLIPLKSINYFGELDPNLDPPQLNQKLSFNKVIDRLNQAVLFSDRKF